VTSTVHLSARRPSGLRRSLNGLRQDGPRTLVMAGALIVVGWLVLYPLAILFQMGLRTRDGAFTLQNYVAVFTEPGLSGALVNSVVISAATTAVSLVLALPIAWAVARTRMPLRGFVTTAITIAFVIPNFIGAIAWILLLGKNAGLLNVLARSYLGMPLFDIYSMPGLVLVLSLSFFPMIFFAATAALENISPIYEEAAQMSGASAWRGSLQITMPLILPAVVSASALVFLEAMGAFGAPAAIATGGNFQTLTTKLYDMFTYPPRFELAAAAATPIIAFTVLSLLLQRAMLGRRSFAVIGGKAARAQPVEIGWARWVLFAYSMLVILAAVALPAFVLVRASLLTKWVRPFIWRNITADNYRVFLDTGTFVPGALLNSLVTAAATASLACVLGVVVVWIVERTTLPGRGIISFVSTVTFAFPGIALAVGFVLGYNGGLLPLYGTLWLFLLAFTAQRFPFAFMFLRNALKQLSTELEDAGRMSGASWGRTLIDISVPLLKSGLLAAWIMVFAVTMRELSMAILLYVRGTETLPVAIFSFVDDGTFETAASLSVVLVIVSIVSVLLLRRLAGRSTMAV
jgi:iron(III) transport system permease protein